MTLKSLQRTRWTLYLSLCKAVRSVTTVLLRPIHIVANDEA